MAVGTTVHVYAPAHIGEQALDDYDCPRRCSDGRRCGGRWALVEIFEWYDPTCICLACGRAPDQGGRRTGKALARARARFHEVRGRGLVWIRQWSFERSSCLAPRHGGGDVEGPAGA